MITDGTLTIETLTATDWVRARELCSTYSNLPLGVTDASIIAIAERHGQTRIATLDRRHFHIVKPAHTTGFEVIP